MSLIIFPKKVRKSFKQPLFFCLWTVAANSSETVSPRYLAQMLTGQNWHLVISGRDSVQTNILHYCLLFTCHWIRIIIKTGVTFKHCTTYKDAKLKVRDGLKYLLSCSCSLNGRVKEEIWCYLLLYTAPFSGPIMTNYTKVFINSARSEMVTCQNWISD